MSPGRCPLSRTPRCWSSEPAESGVALFITTQPALMSTSAHCLQIGQKPQSAHPRKEEVLPTAHLHESGQSRHPDPVWGGRNHHLARAVVVPANRVFRVIKAVKFGAAQPGLLDEFELALNV